MGAMTRTDEFVLGRTPRHDTPQMGAYGDNTVILDFFIFRYYQVRGVPLTDRGNNMNIGGSLGLLLLYTIDQNR